MAKIRRIVRKLRPAAATAFDDQLWPVMVALVVLGGFVMGALLAYLRFDDPRWYTNALTWLIATVLVTAGVAAALAMLENRTFRRSLQLAIILGLFLHTVLFVASVELHIFDRILEAFRGDSEPQEIREVVTVPEYFERAEREQQREAFERPVETDDPAPQLDMDELEREETEQEPVPPDPQPTPVPEPEQTAQPNLMRRLQTEQPAPRFSEQPSQLSRRLSAARTTPPTTAVAPVQVATPRPNAASRMQAQDSDVQQRDTDRQVTRRAQPDAPSTQALAPNAAVARRQTTRSPQTTESSTPSYRRSLNRPIEVPKTEVELSQTPAVTQQTDPHELRPHTTLAEKRITATPERPQRADQPTPDTTANVPARPQRRQLPAEQRPAIAETPVPVPNQRVRATPRPEVATSARPVTPTETPAPPREQPTLAESSTGDVQRTRTEATISRPLASVEPTRTPRSQPANATRRQLAPAAPSTMDVAADTPQRQRTTPSVTVDSEARATTPPAAAAPQPAQQALAARSVTAARSAVSADRMPAVSDLSDVSDMSNPSDLSDLSDRSDRSDRSDVPAAMVSSAPRNVPRRSTETPSITASAQAVEAATMPTIQATGTAAESLAARGTTAQRQATDGAARDVAANVVSAGAASPTAATALATTGATRRPNAPDSPQDASAPVSSPARRQSAEARPNLTTIAAVADTVQASVSGRTDAPRPSLSTIARQPTADTGAQRSQPAARVPSASTATQVAAANTTRARVGDMPSLTPEALSRSLPTRAATRTPIAASPANIENPAVAASTRGVSSPSAAPARTALTKSITGTAGVGQGLNLDRANPAGETPAMVASSSARRAVATQDTPPGPDMAPQNPAIVPRSRAGEMRPGATLQAEPIVELATSAGRQEPAQLAANSSAALTRSSADATPGPVSATPGSADVDVGPTQVVSEGRSGRASGGGQPHLNFETDSPLLARSTNVGGVPNLSIAAAAVAEAPMAPETGGGQPMVAETEMAPTAVARTDPGASEPVSGGPTRATEAGPPTETSMATEVSDVALTRTEMAESLRGQPEAGGGELDEDEEERRRRLARARSGRDGPPIPTSVDTPTVEQLAATNIDATQPQAVRTDMGRSMEPPTLGNPSAATAAARSGGEPDNRSVNAPGIARRAEVPEGTPDGPPAMDLAASGVGRTALASRRPTTTGGTEASPIETVQGEMPADDVSPGPAQVAMTRQNRMVSAPEIGTSVDVPEAVAAVTPGGAASAAQSLGGISRSRDSGDVSGFADPGDTGSAPSLATQLARSDATRSPTLAVAAPASVQPPMPGGPTTETDATASSEPTTSGAGPQVTALARSVSATTQAGNRPADMAQPTPASGATGGELLAANRYTRAEASEGTIGHAETGGGTDSPKRSARGPTLATDLSADTTSLAGMANSAGAETGSPLAAQGIEPARVPGGRVGLPDSGPIGTSASDLIVEAPVAGQPGTASGSRRASAADVDGPLVASNDNHGLPLSRSERTNLPAGSATLAMVDVPSLGAPDTQETAADESLGGGATDMDISRQAMQGGLAVNLDATEGPGGLGPEFTQDVGLNSRRAMPESLHVALRTARFVRRNVGGLPDLSTSAIVATEPFRRRMSRDDGDGSGGGPGPVPPMTEEAIQLGLGFLSRHQLSDGSWSLQGINGERAALVTDTAATALALLAFQGDGCTHRGQRYSDVVRAGVNYLLENQKDDGDLFVPLDDESNRAVWLYSHALATLALCEAYGMTQDPALREPTQKALDFVVAAQRTDRGGWRYSPQVGSDTSVTGWMMMALKSGELANLNVPKETYDKIQLWLSRAQAPGGDSHLYRYNPYAPDTTEQRHGRQPSKTMTSVGLLMRLYLGWDRDNANMVHGAEYLVENLPDLGTVRRPERDTYYWYYATQVMFHMGGDYWERWNGRLHPLLVESQIKRGPLAGSWDPRKPVPDRWAPHAGRLYVTTMNLLSLEVHYRHLPLYKETAR